MSTGHTMCTSITVHIRLTCILPKTGNIMWTLPEIFRTSPPNFLHVACTWQMECRAPFLWCRTFLLELNKSWCTGHTICTYSTVHIRLTCTLSTTGNIMWRFLKNFRKVHLISFRWPAPDTWNSHAPSFELWLPSSASELKRIELILCIHYLVFSHHWWTQAWDIYTHEHHFITKLIAWLESIISVIAINTAIINHTLLASVWNSKKQFFTNHSHFIILMWCIYTYRLTNQHTSIWLCCYIYNSPGIMPAW